MNVNDDLGNLFHNKLEWLKLGSYISKGKVSISEKLLLNSQYQLNILIKSQF